jgi:hypothetical protein
MKRPYSPAARAGFQRRLARDGVASLVEIRWRNARAKLAPHGWPEDLRPREVQILDLLWQRGPQTRRQMCVALGLPWKGSRRSLKAHGGGSYLGALMRRGLVICLGKCVRTAAAVKRRGANVHLYTLALWIERKTA